MKYSKISVNRKNTYPAYTYNKIICDNPGTPIDYQIIETGIYFEKLAGKSKNELEGKKITEVFPDKNAELSEIITAFGKTALTGEETEFCSYFPPFEKTCKIKCLSWDKVYFAAIFTECENEKIKSNPVFNPADNICTEKICLYDMIKDVMTEYIFLADSKGTILASVNADNLLGYSRDYIKGKNLTEFIYSEDKEKAKEILSLVSLKPDEKITENIRVLSRDNKYYWWEITAGIKKAEDDFLVVLSCTDIDDIKRVENEYAEFFNQSSDLLCIADINGNFVKINPGWEKTLAYSPELLKGKNFFEFIHPDDIKPTREALKLFEKQKEIKGFINRFRHRDGSYRWAEWQARKNENLIFASARDITGKITAKKKLEESEKKYRLLAENMGDVVWTTDLDGKINYISPSVAKLTGELPEELYGKSLYDMIHPEDKENLIKIVKSELLSKSDSNQEYYSTIRYLSKDKEDIWTAVRLVALRDEKRNITGLHGVTKNISAQKKAEESLKISRERFARLFYDVSSVAIQGYSPSGKVIYWNKGSEILYGYTEKEAMGKYITDLIIPDEIKPEVKSNIENMLLYNKPVKNTEQLYLKDKSNNTIPVLSNHVVIKTGDNTPELFCMDVDLRHEKIAQEELNKEKDLFKTTLLSVSEGVISTDHYGNVMIINESALHIIKYSYNEAKGQPLHKIFNIAGKDSSYLKNIKKSLVKEKFYNKKHSAEIITKTGKKIPVDYSLSPFIDGNDNVTGFVITFRDNTENSKKTREIKRLSSIDSHTGLYNRKFFTGALERADNKENYPLAIIMCDVNGLKIINDSLGYSAGDKILSKTSDILTDIFSKNNIIARMGGDEFSVIMPKTSPEKVKEKINEIKKAMEGIKVHNIEISLSFGYAIKDKPEPDAGMLLKKAEKMMESNKLYESPSTKGKIINNIVNSLNSKSPREKEHSRRVSEICGIIGEKMGFEDNLVKELKAFGILHDIGKIAIDDKILNKPGKLTEAEREEMKRHSEIGYRILSTDDNISQIAKYVLHHHEKWDGTGYPSGIKGEKIPLFSRICAVADAYDAMTSKRSYKNEMSEEDAIEEIKRESGKHFDPHIAEIFIEAIWSEKGEKNENC